MNSQFIRFFKMHLMCGFKFNDYILQSRREEGLLKYMNAVENDLNKSFNKLKNEYERH